MGSAPSADIEWRRRQDVVLDVARRRLSRRARVLCVSKDGARLPGPRQLHYELLRTEHQVVRLAPLVSQTALSSLVFNRHDLLLGGALLGLFARSRMRRGEEVRQLPSAEGMAEHPEDARRIAEATRRLSSAPRKRPSSCGVISRDVTNAAARADRGLRGIR